jgi:hypothetical protein
MERKESNEPRAVAPLQSQELRSEKIYTLLEICCVLFWFLLDGFWLLEWKNLTYAFSVLAVLVAIAMFFFIKRERVIVLIACADTSWLVLNILWAMGDLSHLKPALAWAKILFGVGFGFCVLAFAVSGQAEKLSVLVLSRLRIIKHFERKLVPLKADISERQRRNSSR